jgi:zinc protease
MKRAGLLLGFTALAHCGGGAPPPPNAAAPPAPAPITVAAPTANAPAPADPPPVVDADVTSGTVSGIPVIVHRTPGAEFVYGQLYVRGGARTWTEANAGIDGLALGVATSGGTTTMDKTAFGRRLASLGADLNVETHNDFSGVGVLAPLATWDDAFAMFADAFRNPALPASEVELQRAGNLSALKHEAESADGRAWTLERKQLFAGHPYANRPTGTVESMTAIKAEALGPWLDGLRQKGRLLFVASGDVDAAHVFAQVARAFGDLPAGNYVESPMPAIPFTAPHLVTEQRAIPTNYVQAAFASPTWSEPDFVTALVALTGFRARLWEEVRTKRNLAYAVQAYDNNAFALPFGMISLTSVDPNAAYKVVLDQIHRLQTDPLDDQELAAWKSEFLTDYLSERETTRGQTMALGDAQVYIGDWHLARTMPDRVRALTAADIQAFAKKYLKNIQAAVLGDPHKVDASLFTSQ